MNSSFFSLLTEPKRNNLCREWLRAFLFYWKKRKSCRPLSSFCLQYLNLTAESSNFFFYFRNSSLLVFDGPAIAMRVMMFVIWCKWTLNGRDEECGLVAKTRHDKSRTCNFCNFSAKIASLIILNIGGCGLICEPPARLISEPRTPESIIPGAKK